MNDDKRVRTLIDNIEVEGLVTYRSSYDYRIKIIKPFQNISGGLHIACFARENATFKGVHGDECILSTLEELYALGKYIAKEMNTLKEELGHYNEIVAKFSSELINENGRKIKQIELRKRLRKGEIDNKEYLKSLSAFRKESKELQSKIWEQKDLFFEKNFPMIVSVGTDTEVMDIIAAKNSLISH